jgi:hypothetical protein
MRARSVVAAAGTAVLLVGAPNETVLGGSGAGAVHVVPGTSGGLTGAGSRRITQDSPGVPDVVESSDLFGAALAGTHPATG